jgi:hypothetical protein
MTLRGFFHPTSRGGCRLTRDGNAQVPARSDRLWETERVAPTPGVAEPGCSTSGIPLTHAAGGSDWKSRACPDTPGVPFSPSVPPPHSRSGGDTG